VKEKIVDPERGIYLDEELWNSQIRSAFSIAIEVMPLPPVFKGPKNEVDLKIKEWFEKVSINLPSRLKDRYNRFLDLAGEGSYPLNPGHLYGFCFELLGALIDYESKKFGYYEEGVGTKCHLCGIRNVLRGPVKDVDNYREVRKAEKIFWKNMFDKFGKELKIKEGERLCSICTIKRFYRDMIEERWNVGKQTLSVSTIATNLWREKIKGNIKDEKTFNLISKFFGTLRKIEDKLGIDLHYDKSDPMGTIDGEFFYEETYTIDNFVEMFGESLREKLEENWKLLEEVRSSLRDLYKKFGKPPKYYAILMMDGDEMGGKLTGETLKEFKAYVHDEFLKDIQDDKNNGLKSLFDERRVLSATVHTLISKGLKNFSVYKVREIIEKYHGELLYSGGDDVLALLPAANAVRAALEIRSVFSKPWDDGYILLGEDSTMSGGVVFSHYKSYPLYAAINVVRECEHNAKEDYDRAALCLAYIKGGQMIKAGGKWDVFMNLLDVCEYIKGREEDYLGVKISISISPRFVYDVIDILVHTYLDSENVKMTKKDIQVAKFALKYELQRHTMIRQLSKGKKLSRKDIEKRKDELIDHILEEIMNCVDFYEKCKYVRIPLLEVFTIIRILTDEGVFGR